LRPEMTRTIGLLSTNAGMAYVVVVTDVRFDW